MSIDNQLHLTIQRLERQLSQIQQEKVEAEFAYLSMINSLSWKVTSPLRAFITTLKRLRAWFYHQRIQWRERSSSKPRVHLISDKTDIKDQIKDISFKVDQTISNYFGGTM